MSYIQYEYPTNQQTRKFLRLEQLFRTIRGLTDSTEPASQRAALFRLVELIDFFDRNDVKGELIKELERQQGQLMVLSENPAVDASKLSYFINQMEKLSESLSHMGRPGDLLRDDPVLQVVRQKWSLGGACCSADAPLIHYFLSQPGEQVGQQLRAWLEKVRTLRTAVNVILKLYRESGEMVSAITQNGHFQEPLDPKVRLVLLRLPESVPVLPEVSVGQHRLSLSLQSLDTKGGYEKTEIQFQLAKCRA